MKIAVVGTGYVGLVTGTCLADYGNDVICVDVIQEKIEKLKKGIIPIYEPGLEGMVLENYQSGRLDFTTDIQSALQKSDICFIAVGTPMGEDGSADLQYVLGVAESIGKYMDHHIYVIDKSTVPVGTAKKVRETIQKELDKRQSPLTFDVISNPEFLKEGTAVEDCSRPDRIVIGTDNDDAAKVMREMYLPLVKNTESFIFMDIASAEMTKYTANAMLATKISFMNEISNICELVGADVNKVRMGIGSDHRIGFQFIYPGCGYGGSCFPKDVRALIKTGTDAGYTPRLLTAVESVNEEQKLYIPRRIAERYGNDLRGLSFAVWGLSFKPNTDDMRCAASVVIINELTGRGARVHAYDPKASDEALAFYLGNNCSVDYFDDKYKAADGCDALVLVTEWEEFLSPDFDKLKTLLKAPVIYDGRNVYSAKGLEKLGFDYYQIGVAREENSVLSRT